MTTMLIMFLAVLRKEVSLKFRYRLELFSSLVFSVVVAAGLLAGLQIFSDEPLAIGDRLGLLFGFALWTILVSNFFSLSALISSEAETGTLEHLYVSVRSIYPFFLWKCLTAHLLSLVTILPLFTGLVLAFTGRLDFSLLRVLPVLTLGLPAVWGLGLAMGGLTLLFKRVDTLAQSLPVLLFAAFPWASTKSDHLAFLLPLGWAMRVSQEMMNRGAAPAPSDLLLILANAAFHAALGTLMYAACERRARTLGKLGHY